MKISVDCYAAARRAGGERTPLDAGECRAAGLDGLEETDVEIAAYLDDPQLADEGLIDGGVRYWLDKRGDLRATVRFLLPARLSASQVRALTAGLQAQLQDGWGEGRTIATSSGEVAIEWFERRSKTARKLKVTQVDDKAPVPDRRTPAIIKAAEKGDITALKRALASGVDADARGRWDMTALMIVARDGHVECVKLLLQNGADTDIVSRENGSTALTHAAMSGNETIAKLLIAARGSLSLGQKSPLHWAANRGHDSLVRAFLEAGADVSLIDDRGETPLFLTHHPEIIGLLIKAGADINFRNPRGQTAHAHALDQADFNERTRWPTGVEQWRAAAEELERWGQR